MNPRSVLKIFSYACVLQTSLAIGGGFKEGICQVFCFF